MKREKVRKCESEKVRRRSCAPFLILSLSHFLLFLSLFSQYSFSQTGWTIFNTSNSSLLDNGIQTVAVDQNGRKWVGCTYGLGVYNDTAWTIYTSINSGLPDDNVKSLIVDRHNNIWIGTNNGGLAKFDGTTWTVWSTSNSLLPGNEVKCIALDSFENKWLGTDNGMAKFNDTTFTVWNLGNTGLFIVDVPSIAIDKHNVKYISSINSGLFYFNDTNFIQYTFSNSYLQDNSVECVTVDSSGNRWFGTAGKGFMAQHTDSVTWEWYDPNNTPSDPSFTVYCILVDSAQNKYTGNQLTGLIKFDGTSWTIWNTSNSPIPDNWVNCLAQEKNGVFWIGTINGLARFDEKLATSIENNKAAVAIYAYPNPAKDFFNININKNNCSLEIYNVYGSLVMNNKLSFGNNIINFNDKDFSSGTYFYRINSNESTAAIGKLIINH